MTRSWAAGAAPDTAAAATAFQSITSSARAAWHPIDAIPIAPARTIAFRMSMFPPEVARVAWISLPVGRPRERGLRRAPESSDERREIGPTSAGRDAQTAD